MGIGLPGGWGFTVLFWLRCTLLVFDLQWFYQTTPYNHAVSAMAMSQLHGSDNMISFVRHAWESAIHDILLKPQAVPPDKHGWDEFASRTSS
jgi:hypothetical protein